IADNPTLAHRRGSFVYDDEGTLAENSLLVKDGILQDFMYDKLTALKTGKKSNGHARRQSYEFRPIVRMSNTMILPGKEDPADIIRSVSSGLLVKMMGGGQVDTITGDFMFEVNEGY